MQVELGEHPVERLADMLREAERAHGLYEQSIGHRDDNWPAWYARHIIDRLTEDESSRSELSEATAVSQTNCAPFRSNRDS